MGDLTLNKILGAVLATLLVIVGLGQLTDIIFKYEAPAKAGYAVTPDLPAAGGAAAPVELPIDWGTELPKADAAAGKVVAEKCQACHNLDQGGPNMTGPNLYGVLGRPPGTHPGFAYSDGMKAFGAKNPIWTYELINSFVTSPQNFIDGTKMTFVGLKQRQDRINVIAYLHTLGSSLPIPAPKPAAAAPAASGAPAQPGAAASASAQAGNSAAAVAAPASPK